MSQEVQLTFACPHLIVEERVLLGDDRRSLPTLQPVASHGLVRIMVNDEFFVPPGGMAVPAELFSSLSGPYRISKYKNQLSVTNSKGTITVDLPIGERIATDRIVSLFLQKLTSMSVRNVGGNLVFTDLEETGKRSRIYVKGSAATSLGFNMQSGSRGADLYPPWHLTKRADEITNLYPQFTQVIKTNPVFKVTYSVPVQRCLRCQSSFIENDARFDAQGEVIRIDNENLLYQAALKIILTQKGSNPYLPWYGTSIQSRIGTKALSTISAVISEDVRTALKNLQAIQNEQSRYQDVTYKEKLYQVLSVQTSPSADDPTVFLLDVTVQNSSSDPITLSIIFAVPGAVPLLNR